MKDAQSNGWCSHLDLIPINFFYNNIAVLLLYPHLFFIYAKFSYTEKKITIPNISAIFNRSRFMCKYSRIKRHTAIMSMYLSQEYIQLSSSWESPTLLHLQPTLLLTCMHATQDGALLQAGETQFTICGFHLLGWKDVTRESLHWSDCWL